MARRSQYIDLFNSEDNGCSDRFFRIFGLDGNVHPIDNYDTFDFILRWTLADGSSHKISFLCDFTSLRKFFTFHIDIFELINLATQIYCDNKKSNNDKAIELLKAALSELRNRRSPWE